MQRDGRKSLLIEAWAFVAVAAIAFVGGLLIGDLGSSPKTETVSVAASSTEGAEAEVPEPIGEATESEEGAKGTESELKVASNSPGAQIFTAAGCGTCHVLAAAGSTGETGPDLEEFLAPDDTTEAVEEMIVDPSAEIAEGYPPNVMPETYSRTLSKTEVHQLAEYLVATTPAKPDPEAK